MIATDPFSQPDGSEGDEAAPRPGRFADNIVYFARALRAAGMPVGPGAVVDAVAAVAAGGLARREDLYWVLHAVFVRRREHAVLFDHAFRLFWRRRGFVEQQIAQMLPVAPPDRRDPEKPKPGENRVAEALRPKPRQPPEIEIEREVSARLTVSDRERLKARDFAQMSAEEVARAKRLIAGLDLPDDRQATRRLVPDRRGRTVDLRRSLRASMKSGGSAIDLAFRSRDTRPPPLVALVDISGSMAEYSRLFLHFLHALAEKRRRVHVFVFATRLTNITRDLAQRDPDEALARAGARVLDWEGGTRIAGALHDFNRIWSRRVLGGGATVLLFTDGLEREVGDDLPFELDRLHRSCRRLVWLNPLLRFSAFEARASGIRVMLPHVDEFRPLHNLGSMDVLVAALGGRGTARTDPGWWLRQSDGRGPGEQRPLPSRRAGLPR